MACLVRPTVLTKVCVRTWVMGLVVIVATVVTVDSLLDVFVGVVVVNFLVVVVWLLGQGVSGMEDL